MYIGTDAAPTTMAQYRKEHDRLHQSTNEGPPAPMHRGGDPYTYPTALKRAPKAGVSALGSPPGVSISLRRR